MSDLVLTQQQMEVVHGPPTGRVFLSGVAGTGKTTTGVARMRHLLDSGVPADALLVLVPQRTLAQAYYESLREPEIKAGGVVSVATMGGLARRMIDLFWPMVAEMAGFAEPEARPMFLTLETAQYYMARIVDPLIEKEGYFESVTMDRNRIYVQILSNLSKAAVVGFPPTEISARLKGAWMGETAYTRVYDEAQTCALTFRRYCLEHNLLDFSLQMTIFAERLWNEPLCRDHLINTYRHIIYDNAEEDTPVAHDLAYAWLGEVDSALVIVDEGAGYRTFLSADPASAGMLQDLCERTYTFANSFVVSPPVAGLSRALDAVLRPVPAESKADDGQAALAIDPVADLVPLAPAPKGDGAPDLDARALRRVLRFTSHRFHPEMLDWVADEIQALVHNEGMLPGEIAVLSPFLTDALRFSLADRLERAGVPVRSHWPGRALRDEPASQTLLTLTALAHPDWDFVPSRYDVAYALRHAIGELDLVRAQLLAEAVYRVEEHRPVLTSFDEIDPDTQERITFLFGGRYEALRTWLASSHEEPPAQLDHFLARLFGEVLSQPGFGFHRDVDSGQVAAVLIESVRKFRWASQDSLGAKPLGQEYLEMVRHGVIAAQYLQPWQDVREDAVLLASAYTFLMSNRPVDIQFWLGVGGVEWWGGIHQPLTHPYVLSRQWPQGKIWTDEVEFALRQRNLQRLVLGLLRRCRRAVYLGLSEISEQGFDQEGPLLRVIQQVLRRARAEEVG